MVDVFTPGRPVVGDDVMSDRAYVRLFGATPDDGIELTVASVATGSAGHDLGRTDL